MRGTEYWLTSLAEACTERVGEIDEKWEKSEERSGSPISIHYPAYSLFGNSRTPYYGRIDIR